MSTKRLPAEKPEKQSASSAVVAIDRIDAWPLNPRKVTEKDLGRLKKQIERYGVYKPLICCREGNRYTVLGGNMRLRALRELGQTHVWVSVVKPRNDQEKIEISLSDNDRVGYYDRDQLAALVDPFKATMHLEDFAVDIKVPDIGLDDIVDRAAVSDDDGDVVPELPKQTAIKRGDMFQLGKHRLLCGDATSPDDFARLMGNDLAGVVFTDPPYNVSYRGTSDKQWMAFQYDGMSDDKFDAFLRAAFQNIHRFTQPNVGVYVCHADSTQILFRNAIVGVGFNWSASIIWLKNSPTFNRGCYKYQHEPIYYFQKGRAPWYGGDTQSTVWHEVKDIGDHPTIKPIGLIIKALVNSSNRWDICLDAFLGSGSTLIACEKINRVCYGMEIEPRYCQLIIDRWECYTRQKVKRV